MSQADPPYCNVVSDPLTLGFAPTALAPWDRSLRGSLRVLDLKAPPDPRLAYSLLTEAMVLPPIEDPGGGVILGSILMDGGRSLLTDDE